MVTAGQVATAVGIGIVAAAITYGLGWAAVIRVRDFLERMDAVIDEAESQLYGGLGD